MNKKPLFSMFLLCMLVALSACSRTNLPTIESSSTDTVVTTDPVKANNAPQHNQLTSLIL